MAADIVNDTIPATIVRPPSPPGPVRWLQKNLLGTWYNALLTVLATVFLFFVLRSALTWVLFTANWAPVTNSLKLFTTGQYPPDELWRVGTIVLVVSFLFGLSWCVWGGTVRTFALTMAVAFGILALLPLGMGWNLRLWFLGNPVLTFVGYQVGRTRVGKSRWVALGWLLSFVLTIFLLTGIKGGNWLPKVETGLWGGLLLTFLLLQ